VNSKSAFAFSDLDSFDQLGVSAVTSLSQINSDVGVVSNGLHYGLAIFRKFQLIVKQNVLRRFRALPST
jgi:hypothetical protein